MLYLNLYNTYIIYMHTVHTHILVIYLGVTRPQLFKSSPLSGIHGEAP